ncbi:MAG TPA: DMT family transporter [Bacteroidales bacterium]|nr:DMT family transporter [Bacteroidales bacterium]
MGNNTYIHYISLFFAMLFWGASFVLTKHLLIDFNPIFIIFARLLISSLIFVSTTLILFKRKFFIQKKHFILFISLAFFEPFVYFIFETYSLKMIDPSIVSVIIATIPLFMALFAFYFLKEFLTRKNMFGVVLSVFGIVVMLFPEFYGSTINFLGVAFAFGAVFSTIGYNYFLQKVPHQYSSLLVITWQNLIGLAAFIPILLIMNTKTELKLQFDSLGDYKNLLFLILLAVFCSSIAFILYIKGVRAIGTARSNIFTNLIPVITASISFFLFDEAITWNKVIGIITVISGIFLVQMRKKRIS